MKKVRAKRKRVFLTYQNSLFYAFFRQNVIKTKFMMHFGIQISIFNDIYNRRKILKDFF